jgi:hypothetical protein
VKKGANYKYWNKAFGTKHWMEHALGFPNKPRSENVIVILMDPDQILNRPFRNNDFSNTEWVDHKPGQKPRTAVEHGKPMAQRYAFGLEWKKKYNMDLLLHDKPSPILNLTDAEALAGYVIGPPYIATASDMYKIVSQWCGFNVPVHDQDPDEFVSEMYAYILAVAHLGLPHQTAVR